MATENVAITDTADDQYHIVGVGLVDDTVWIVGFGLGAAFNGGLRFLSVDVPQGATISSAILTWNITAVNGTPSLNIYGVDADTAEAWADPGNLPTDAARTTASTAYAPPGVGSDTVDLVDEVQEIVNRAGWASGAALAIVVIDAAGSGTNNMEVEDISAAGTAHATIDITYTVVVPPPSAARLSRPPSRRTIQPNPLAKPREKASAWGVRRTW